jgi:Arc/MetJ-type ribon-helix-helix transcriptional regulator
MFNSFKSMMEAAKSEGHVIGSKISAVELEQIKQLVASGVYLNTSDFVRDAIRDKLATIKTIKYRDIDYEAAKKEVMGYFQERGEAYASEIEEDLELDYSLVRQIITELKREGRLEVL